MCAFAARVVAQVPRRKLVLASASAVAMLVAAVLLFQWIPIVSTTGEVLSEATWSLAQGVDVVSKASSYSSARLVHIPASAVPVGITGTDLVIEMSNASMAGNDDRSTWMVL